MEEKENNNITNTYLLCHFCKNLYNKNNLINCSDDDCQEGFCKNCIEKYFKLFNSYPKLKEESNENGWICYKCQKLCNCQSCSIFFRNYEKQKFDNNNKKIMSFEDCPNEAKIINFNRDINKKNNNKINDSEINLLNKKNEIVFDFLNDKNYNTKKNTQNNENLYYQQYFNSFNNQNECELFYNNLINAANISLKRIISPFLRKKLIKIAILSEKYYYHKCKTIFLKKNCDICFKNEHCLNEILRFKNSKDFLNYLRYLYLCKYEIVDYSNDIFLNNKKELLNSFRDYEKENSTWSFHIPKILCKSCVLKIINKKNSFDIFKKILIDKDKNKEKINEDNIKVVIDNPPEKKEVKFHILEILKNEPKNEEKFNDPISEKRYDELRDILDILLQNIYKFILVVNSFNFQRYQHLFTLLEQDFKYFYEYLIKIQENIKYNLKSFIEFQENYGHQINEFIRSYHNSSNTEFLFQMNFMFSIKIQNKSFSEGIQENVEKFLKYSNDYLDNILKRIINK